MINKIPNGQKWRKIEQKMGPKQPKRPPKWSEMFRQMVQIMQGIPTPNYLTKND